ncbi:hypothetical protein WKU33_07675 [Oceanobacillus sp. HCA-5259]|uniref:hypothetical protein n=1 Tax=Oceanobacillus sp. HCA-5259 TaxID=3134661 RepID=UPI0030C46958
MSKFVIEKTAIWTFDENYLKTAEFKVTCNDLYKAKKAAPQIPFDFSNPNKMQSLQLETAFYYTS